MKKLKLAAITVTGALALMACTPDNENDTEEGTDENVTESVQFSGDIATIKGNDFGSDDVLNGLIEGGTVPPETVVQNVLDEVLEQYYPVTDEEIEEKMAQVKSFEESSGNEVDDAYLEQNREYIAQSAQLEKALEDVVEVTEEQKDELYEQMKTKYDVVDILVFSEDSAELGKELRERAENASEEELEELMEEYSDSQEVHVDVMSYTEGEIPIEDTTQLEDFNESGDVIENETETAYNALILQEVTNVEREDIEDRLHETALYEQVGSTVEILGLLAEEHSDLQLSDELQEMLEEPEVETGVNTEPDVEEGEDISDEDMEVIEEAIDEEENNESDNEDSE